MIYIILPSSERETANKWIEDNLDRYGGNSFIENKVDSEGNKFCVISFPDNDQTFANSMKEHFSDYVASELTDLNDIDTI
jgi:hypothetical protein